MSASQSKYKVLQKIGEGSFSEVLKCEDLESGVCYAAKRLKKSYKTEASITTCAEVIAAQKVPYHSNILNMLAYHYDAIDARVTFIFELMDMSMHDYLKTKTRGLSEHRVRSYLFQMVSGLSHLHSHGLFHRDVKPENILIKFPSILDAPLSQVSNYEIIKLADLGSVRGIFSEPPYTEYISTRWYRSPECLLTSGHYGPKMDVWAVGCVFYEMLTLKPLFPGSNEIDQLCKIHQVLGTPPLQYLSKLKSRSRNCIFFPKAYGAGIDIMIPFVTKNGRNMLRLMLEYDSEKRVNVKRLLKNCYFDNIRDTSEGLHKLGQEYPHISEPIKRCRGDDGSAVNAYPMVKKKADQLITRGSKESAKSGKSIKSEKSGKSTKSTKSNKSMKWKTIKSTSLPCTDHNIPYFKSNAHKTGNVVSSLPLVSYKVQKTLRDDSSKKSVDKKAVKEVNLKAKSNVETRKAQASTKNYFQSKSSVITNNDKNKIQKSKCYRPKIYT